MPSAKNLIFSVFWATFFFLQPHPVFFLAKKFCFYHVGCFHEQKVGVSAKRPCRQRKTSFFFSFLGKNFFSSATPCFFLTKKFRFYHVGCFHELKSWGFSQTAMPSAKTSFFQFFGPNFFFFSHTLFFSRQKVSFLSRGGFHEQKVGVSAKRPCRQR